MGLISRLRTWLTNALKIAGVPTSQLETIFGATESAAGVTVDAESALSLSAVFGAASILSRTVGSLPLSVYRRRPDSGKDLALNDRAFPLLHTQPNPWMTAASFRRTLEFHRLMWGNCYAEITWDGGGRVAALWPIEPWRVTAELTSGHLLYVIDGSQRIPASDILHVPLISYDGVCGRSFVDYALQSLGLGIAAQEFAARFFGNGAKPGGLLEHPGDPGEPARKKFREEWQRAHGGPNNAHKTGVLWGGWKYNREAGAIQPTDAQLLETRKFTTEEVARWFNVPPHLLAELTRTGLSNFEEQQLNFVVYSIGPTLVDYEQEYDRKLLRPPQVFSKHNLGGLLRGNYAARAAFFKEMFGMGVFSPNDICELEDRNPIGPEGNTHFVAANNYQPISKVINPPEPVPKAPAAVPGPVMPDPEAVATAHQELLAEVFIRLGTKEINAAVRASKSQEKFSAWPDEFYPRHQPILAEALARPIRVIAAVSGATGPTAESVAAVWVQESRASWASGCPDPEELFTSLRARASDKAIDLVRQFKQEKLACAA